MLSPQSSGEDIVSGFFKCPKIFFFETCRGAKTEQNNPNANMFLMNASTEDFLAFINIEFAYKP